MDIKQANKLVNKCVHVILSCTNLTQLENATRYADLVYRQICNGVGLVNNTQFTSLTERSIGFAQCQIGHDIKEAK